MIDLARIRAARDAVSRWVSPSPLIHSEHFSRLTGAEVYLKLENLQRTGSFKVRGALNKLLRCREAEGPRPVVAASAGNHAQGVALAAATLGISATIVMPENSAISKQLATRDYGGRVLLHGSTVAEALERARALAEEGYCFVHPYDDEDVIAGQGAVALEILEQGASPDEVWVPVGGGGLVAGIAAALAEERPSVQVVGVQTEACPSAAKALEARQPVTVAPGRSIADGILVSRVGDTTFPLLVRHVREVRVVEETGIASAIVRLLENKKLLAEGAGAVGLAALLSAPPERVRGRAIVVVVSGGNMDLNVLDRVLEQGLIRSGRIFRFAVVLDDVPGALGSLLAVVARHRANVLHIAHDRLSLDLPVGRTRVEAEVETRGAEHIGEVAAALREAGFSIRAHDHPAP
jgi:threonine dehydratase